MTTETPRRLAEIAKQNPTHTAVYAVRGSLIVASLDSLRHFQHYDRYLEALAPMWREQVVFCLASSWAPVELAMAHYAAHESLQLGPAELTAMGEFVSERAAGTFLGAVLRNSRANDLVGSAWTPLQEFGRICERILQGGHVRVCPRSDNDALLEIRGVPMLRFEAFRQTVLALTRKVAGAFARRTFVRALARIGSEQVQIQVRWS